MPLCRDLLLYDNFMVGGSAEPKARSRFNPARYQLESMLIYRMLSKIHIKVNGSHCEPLTKDLSINLFFSLNYSRKLRAFSILPIFYSSFSTRSLKSHLFITSSKPVLT